MVFSVRGSSPMITYHALDAILLLPMNAEQGAEHVQPIQRKVVNKSSCTPNATGTKTSSMGSNEVYK